MRRITALVCATLMAVAIILPVSPVAIAAVDNETAGTITVTLIRPENSGPIPGVNVRLYKAAVPDGDRYRLTEDFAASEVSLTGLTSSKLAVLAKRLKLYVESAKPASTLAQSDAGGEIRFAALEEGLYLVIVEESAKLSGYELYPVLVSVPVINESTGTRDYNVRVYPKVENNNYTKTSGGETTTNPYDTTKPRTTAKNAGSDSSRPTGSSGSATTDEGSGLIKEELPYTGMLRWPIPFLVFAGIACFSYGWVETYLRKSEDDEE